MPTPIRRNILVAGLGRFASSSSGLFPNITLARADMEKARELGFDCKELHLNPADVPGMLEELRKLLKGQRWDGFVIGFGVRGEKENTVLFEGCVNSFVQTCPGARFCFAERPDGIVEALQRVFGLVDE